MESATLSIPALEATPVRFQPAGAVRQARLAGQAVKDFEALLLHRLLQEMRSMVNLSPLADDAAGEQFQDIFWMYLAQDLADKGGLGLCRDLYRQAAGTQATQGGHVELLR